MNNIFYKLKIYGPIKFTTFVFAEIISLFRSSLLHTYSQCGEDIVLDRILSSYKKGFYIDVGAYDPLRFSNTLRFYQKRWRGINIEPNYDQYLRFIRLRPRDINLNIGIGKNISKLLYFQMIPTTLSTFSKRMADDYIHNGFKLEETKPIPVLRLKDVFKDNIPKTPVHFITIDVEGYEMDVLESNDWKKYRPYVICLEIHFSGDNLQNDAQRELMIINYLALKGYIYLTKSKLNYFFVDSNHLSQLNIDNYRFHGRGI